MDAKQTFSRPDADTLLAQVEGEAAKSRRGKLKIFFGMSAGVGKTYAMLEEARKRAAEGVDVLVGYAEPHIRPDTEAVLVALDILPYHNVEYRGAILKEFDLDAALARRPLIVCVDELAHTNAPGMRHPKRWQDVNELLDAGINVYTTLNVQHLESVNDLVERITGVKVRETLPDSIFDAADDVELVDIAPEELLERLREGRIYKPEQAARARTHFFTKGNLLALRELALRKTADRVDEQMLEHRRGERLPQVVPASETVLVCVGPSPLSSRLVRSARRLSAGLRAKLIAVSVEPEGVTGHSAADAERVAATLKLAEEFGATVVTLVGRNVAAELLAYAMAHNVTKIVVGKPARPRWREIVFGSVVDELIRYSGDIDIYVIRSEAETPERTRRVDDLKRRRPHDWFGYLLSIAVVALTTLVGWPLFHRFRIEKENILMLYLLGVLWVATRRSRRAAMLTSVLAVAAFDVTFVPPYYTFAVSDRQYVFTFGVMLLTAFVISALTHRVRLQGDAARHRERRTAALLGLSRDLSAARSIEQIATATPKHVGDFLAAPVVLLIADTQPKPSLNRPASSEAISDKEMGVAQWAFEHAQPAGRDTSTLPAGEWTFIPLQGTKSSMGVLGINLAKLSNAFSGEVRELVESFAAQAAITVERLNLAEEARAAWEQVEAEFLRNTLLSGVSHELRTPLAGIIGAASALAESNGLTAAGGQREMLDTLVSEARRMERVIGNLLDMTRFETGGLHLKKEWLSIGELIGASLHHLDCRLVGRSVTTKVPASLPMVAMDAIAIEQVLVNLIDNAIEYTPAESPIEIGATASPKQLAIEVVDQGLGLPAGTEKRVFQKFFRANTANGTPSRGIGLGLAIARAIVEAHDGTISAFNRPEGGATFRITLPIDGAPAAIDASA